MGYHACIIYAKYRIMEINSDEKINNSDGVASK